MMVSVNQIFLTLATFFAVSSNASAFWFSAEEPKPTNSPRMLYQQPDYYRHYAQAPIPYVPFQVPLPAQMAPAQVQNVQLVPCLCPVNQDYPNEYEYSVNRKSPYGTAQVINQQRKRR